MHDDRPVGELLREWRKRRQLSQLDLAIQAEVSARHVSFVETGRTIPSRAMLLHLAEQLSVPLGERNGLLVAAGYAPVFRRRPLDDPDMAKARGAVEQVLRIHEPYPALAVAAAGTCCSPTRRSRSSWRGSTARCWNPRST